MTSKLTSIAKNLHPVLWQFICLAVSITCFSLILENRSPNVLRPLSIALRSGFGLVIPITAILICRIFYIPGRLGNLLSMAAVLSLFALPLAGLWASGQTQSTVLNGIIPLYDAESYYIDALSLTNGSRFSVFSARRPLFPGLLAVLLTWTGHNLMTALAIFTWIAAFACYVAVREIQRTHGTETATFVLIVLFLFFRAHSGISMTENLGVAFGVLGFALLWQGASIKNLVYLWMGLLITTLALNARAGAFFILPLLIIWTGWLLRENKQWIAWKPAFLATTAVVVGFALNLGLTRLVATPSGVPFANFSYTLFGLASGGESWSYIFRTHPEVSLMQEPEQSIRIYQLAFELIREQPLQLLKGAFFNWGMLFSNTWYNIYAYIGGENWTVNVYARWAMYLLASTGIYACFKDRNDPIKSMILVLSLGVFISVPFLPPTDAYRMRPYAANIIILAALPALGLHYILEKINLKLPSTNLDIASPYSAPLIFSSILIFVTLLGPVVVRARSVPVALEPVSCNEKNSSSVIVHFDEGTYINIKKQGQSFLDWMPDFHAGQFKRNAHSLADGRLIDWAESLEPSTTLFLSLDFLTNQKVWVVFKTDNTPPREKYYQFCGNFETDPFLSSFRIFYTSQALPLSP